MGAVLVLSSYVAASQVGAKPAGRALAAHGFEPVIVPTVLLGRHPGHGAPGGGPVPEEMFAGVLEGVFANVPHFVGVLTGYFASPGQVAAAADAIDRVRAAHPQAFILVDPVMGDEPKGLYVPQAVAGSIKTHLLARADAITPNLFELGMLAAQPTPRAMADIANAARSLGKPALVTSVRHGADIGALYVDESRAVAALEAAQARAPNGAGDLLAGLFLARRLLGEPPSQGAAHAVAKVAALIEKANVLGVSELPLHAVSDEFLAQGRERPREIEAPGDRQ